MGWNALLNFFNKRNINIFPTFRPMTYLGHIFLFIPVLFFAQNITKTDSLLHLLKTARHDTTPYNAYMGIGNYFQNSNPTQPFIYTRKRKILL